VALPFDLPSLSRGFAALDPSARRLGLEVAAAAASALQEVLHVPVALHGRAAPGPAWSRTPSARLAVDLSALPAMAALEVEPGLLVKLVDLLAGGEGSASGATALTPLEQAALELFALTALEAACSVAGVERALAPRLARAGPDAMGVDLELEAASVRGRARLLLPACALRALGDGDGWPESPLRIPVSVRRGTASLLPAELEALEPGDVVLVQDPQDGRETLVLPGGYRATGRLGPDGFHAEEASMSARVPEIPITLEVELCRVEVPLGELARLAPGAILPLAIDRRGQVTLRAGDRALARGELVEVEGAIGVRIASLEAEP
jgi:type III secretion protein Q